MPISNSLAIPNPLSNGTTADATQVMGDLNYLLAALNRALLDSGGGAGMNAQNTQIHNLVAGTSPSDAVALSQLGSYAPLAGAAFTGAVSFAAATTVATLTASGLITANAGLSGTTLNLSGSATLAGITGTTLGLTGNATVGGTLGVTGASTVAALTASGLLTANAGISASTGAFSSTLTVTGAVTMNGGITATGALTPGNLANGIGQLGVPQNLHTTNYTLALSDIGDGVDFNGAGLTCTIPANASVAFPVGAVILITNLNASALSIAITADTLTLSGTTTTGTRTLGQNGEAKIRKVTATSWLISGTALS